MRVGIYLLKFFNKFIDLQMKLEQETVTIIIPTLNEEKYINSCLQSVIDQSYPYEKMDIMVIDGGSTDRTKEIVLNWALRYKNIRLLKNPGRIQAIAFNIGVEHSHSPYIIRLDAHAYYYPEYVSLCIKHLLRNPTYGNVGGKWNIKPGGNTLIARANALLNQTGFGIGGAAYRIGEVAKEVDTVPFGAFPRKVVEKIGKMNEELARGEDNDYNSRIKKSGYRIYFDPDIRADYYARKSIKDSMKQMYTNGVSIGRLLFVDISAVGIRHLVPFVFVMSVFVLVGMCFVASVFGWLLLILLGMYVITDVMASIKVSLKKGFKYMLILTVLFPLIHFSYGIGTLMGIINRR